MKAIFDNIKGACEIEGKVPSRIVCVYDAKRKELRVARDKIGEQTLYYAQLPTSVIISTELKDILPHIAYPKINMLNLAQPIRYNFPIDLQQTWIEQIKRVRAGEELMIDPKGIRNPKAHANETIDKEDALRKLAFASMLMYKLDSVI